MSATRTPANAESSPAALRRRSTSKTRNATEKKAFCARQKISFHHTPKNRLRQPRASRNNATFLVKILAFSTKPFVSVVFSSKNALRRPWRPRFDASSVKKQGRKGGPFTAIGVLIERDSASHFDNITKNVILSSSNPPFPYRFIYFLKIYLANLRVFHALIPPSSPFDAIAATRFLSPRLLYSTNVLS